jgi:hypothetical protein
MRGGRGVTSPRRSARGQAGFTVEGYTMSTVPWVTVYAGGTADTAVLCDLLEGAGITARLGDEMMGAMAPYVIAGGTLAAIKVMVPADRVDDARGIVAEFTERSTPADPPAQPPVQPWECPCCHERNDGWFDICWNCQTQREPRDT